MKIISLGCNCSVAYQLNKLNLKNETFPFDWSKNNINQLIKVLENNFLDYSDSLLINKISHKHKNIYNNDESSLILKNIYNISFAHEINDNIDSFKEKLNRRISRFKNLNSEEIIFIRIELSPINDSYKNKIIKLCELLNNYSNNYTLKLIIKNTIYLSDLDLIKYNIKIYYFDDFDSDWMMNKINWFNVLF